MEGERWDANQDSSAEAASTGAMDRLVKTLAYVLSVPERLARSSAAALAGVLKELSERLLPQVLQNTQLFQAFVARTNRFVLERIAGVEGLYAEDDGHQEGFASRKALSNAIEVGSLVTLHMSPLLVLAAASDCMKGGSALLQSIVKDLREEGIIKEATSVDNFNQLLDGLHDFTSRLALQAELPPLTREELHALGDGIREDVEQLRQRQLLSQDQLDELAAALRQAALHDGKSVWQVSSALAHGSAHALVKSAKIAVGASNSSLRLFDDHIIDFYQEQLGLLVHEGLGHYFKRVAAPYYTAMRKAWDNKTYTWTEAFIHGLTHKQ